MKADDEARWLSVAAAISDHELIDWDALESSATSAEELSFVRTLRDLKALSSASHWEPDAADRPAPGPAGAFPDSQPVPHWGHFALQARLGSGTQGEVFRAVDTRLDRQVALKFLKPPSRGATPEQLLSEARLLARVRHPNVVTVHGAEQLDGRVALWMELVAGDTLDTIVLRSGPMAAGEAALIGSDLCRALAAVHAAGLVHRDVKAQNVMREAGGRYVLMDFGLGHDVGAAGRTPSAGTPLYLAPEVFEGRAATVQSDIYALGVLLYYLVSGQFPVAGRSVPDLVDAHRGNARRRLADVRSDLPAAFIALVERATHPDPARRFGSATEMGDALAALVAPPIGRRSQVSPLWAIAAAVFALVGVATLAWRGLTTGAPAVTANAVAVFPFDDLSADRSLGHVGRGLADLIMTDLGQRTSLRVVATRSRDDRAVRQRADVARDIGVDALVEGSIRPTAAPGLSISVRVIQAGGGTVLWSSTYDTTLEVLFDLERRITDDLAAALRLRLAGSERTAATPPPDALEAYFRGWQEYYGLSPNPTRLARDHFLRAVTLAPDFAQAQAALGYVVGLLGTSYREIPIADALAEAERRAELARTIDPTYGFAEAVLGWVRAAGHWDWSGAEAHYRRAIELNPSDANTRALYSQLLMANNRLEPALAEARVALRLEPLNASRHSATAICLYYLRRFDDAIAESTQLLAADPSAAIAHLGLGRFLSAAGRHDEAVAMIRSGPNRDIPPVQAELARILYVAGRADDADPLAAQLEQAYAERRLAADQLAFVELARGRNERALALLREAVDAHLPSAIWIGVDPRFDALRGTPEFQDLIRQLQFIN